MSLFLINIIFCRDKRSIQNSKCFKIIKSQKFKFNKLFILLLNFYNNILKTQYNLCNLLIHFVLQL